MMFESFSQSQKHQVAADLRQKFRRFINHATPAAEQVMSLLERMFRERTEQIRLSRPGGVAPEISEVGVDMEEILRQVERVDIDLEEVNNFMRAPRFRQHFRVEDD